MSKSVVDVLEPVEIKPDQRETIACIVVDFAEHALDFSTKMQPVGDTRQHIVAGEPIDLLVRLLLVGDILLHIDPAAAGKRAVSNGD